MDSTDRKTWMDGLRVGDDLAETSRDGGRLAGSVARFTKTQVVSTRGQHYRKTDGGRIGSLGGGPWGGSVYLTAPTPIIRTAAKRRKLVRNAEHALARAKAKLNKLSDEQLVKLIEVC